MKIKNPDGATMDGWGILYQSSQYYTAIDYPLHGEEGNDDPTGEDEKANPYYIENAIPSLSHEIGQVTSLDTPYSVVKKSWNTDGFTFEKISNFREFVRLELNSGRTKVHPTYSNLIPQKKSGTPPRVPLSY
jgi:hypothetical protein